MSKKYNHAYTVAFSIDSDNPDGYDVTNEMFTAAILKRIIDLNENDEWDEAVGAPYDTYEVQDDND